MDSSSIALGRSHQRPAYSNTGIRIKMPMAQKTEYLVLVVESTISVLTVKSDIQDLNPKYPVDKQHLCYGVMEVWTLRTTSASLLTVLKMAMPWCCIGLKASY
jgi:hypothetical protein